MINLIVWARDGRWTVFWLRQDVFATGIVASGHAGLAEKYGERRMQLFTSSGCGKYACITTTLGTHFLSGWLSPGL